MKRVIDLWFHLEERSMQISIKVSVVALFTLLNVAGFDLKAQNPNFYIFLCFGQSNMEGQGSIGSQDAMDDPRFQVFQAVDCSNLSRSAETWYNAEPPLCRCWNGLSPADYFGRTLIDELPEHIKVGVINVSIGGSRIEIFDKDIYQNYTDDYSEDWFQDAVTSYNGNPYQYLVDMAKKAQKDGVIKGVLLHQGESNFNDSQWPNKVKTVYDNLMEDLSLDPEKVPLLAGEMVHEDQNGSLAAMNTIVNKLPEAIPNAYVISSSGVSAKSDLIHFDAAGYRELGTRYGEKMLELLEEPGPLGVVNDNGYSLSPGYPNPVVNKSLIFFQIPTRQFVSVKVYDISGSEVKEISSEKFEEGKHEIVLESSDLKPGIYLVRMNAAGFSASQRIVVK